MCDVEVVSQADFHEVFQQEDDDGLSDLAMFWNYSGCSEDSSKNGLKQPRDMVYVNGNIPIEHRVLATNRFTELDRLILTSWTHPHGYEMYESLLLNSCKYVASKTFSEQKSLQDDFEDLQ
jgi:hypothetical protein